MIARALALALALTSGAGAAHAGDRCADLRPMPVARMSQRGHARIAGALRFEDGKRRDWSKIVVTVEIARAPHLVPAILSACPGVVEVFKAATTSARQLSSSVRLRVSGFAVLTRLAQLPAVQSMAVYDPAEQAKRFDFEDPM